MTSTWYVLQSKPNKEGYLYDQLLANRLEAFCPHIRVQPVNPRARKVKPYFPGYVFVQLDLENAKTSALGWMPGAHGLVSFDGHPADVPENLVQAIRRRVNEINAAGGELLESLRPGEKVVI
ncbi:MAG TPA: transcription termination/antitermination NusG family protein, partial [Anaerolineales bacterium]|nr:transcription termination/antitermination NusG family protein [Anaerolineales bacterium]